MGFSPNDINELLADTQYLEAWLSDIKSKVQEFTGVDNVLITGLILPDTNDTSTMRRSLMQRIFGRLAATVVEPSTGSLQERPQADEVSGQVGSAVRRQLSDGLSTLGLVRVVQTESYKAASIPQAKVQH